MRCRRCNYALWDLRERVCPECGTPFRPSEHDLVPSAVQFCCRGCEQPYYGTTWRGHLHPAEFDCVRCGQRVVMDECILRPTEGVDERRTQRGTNALLDRQRGLLGRVFTAIGHSMVKPGEMARGTPMNAGMAGAFLFALAVNTGVYAVCFSLFLLIGMGAGGVPMFALGIIGFFVGAATIGALAWTLLAHAILCVTGERAGTLRQTFLAIHYSAGANTISALICVGFTLGWVWWMVSACMMLREMHRVSGLRAAAAGVIPPLVCVPAVAIGYIYVSTWAAVATSGPVPVGAAAGGPPLAAPLTAVQGATPARVAEALRDAAVSREGQGESLSEHPAELLAYQVAVPGQFIAHNSVTTDETMRVGGQTVRDLDLAPPGQRLEGFRTAMAREALGEGDTPPWRRLGDVVIPDLRSATREQTQRTGLWVLVMSPDPDANGEAAGAARIVVARVDGAAEVIEDDAVATRLEEQNAARRTLGLPDLTDPRAVTQSSAAP